MILYIVNYSHTHICTLTTCFDGISAIGFQCYSSVPGTLGAAQGTLHMFVHHLVGIN